MQQIKYKKCQKENIQQRMQQRSMQRTKHKPHYNIMERIYAIFEHVMDMIGL